MVVDVQYSPVHWNEKSLGGLFLHVDIDPHFIKLSTPMEKKVVVARTDMPTLRICAGYREIYSGPGSPMERLEVTQCSRKSPRFQIHLKPNIRACLFCSRVWNPPSPPSRTKRILDKRWWNISGSAPPNRLRSFCRGFPAIILRSGNCFLRLSWIFLWFEVAIAVPNK